MTTDTPFDTFHFALEDTNNEKDGRKILEDYMSQCATEQDKTDALAMYYGWMVWYLWELSNESLKYLVSHGFDVNAKLSKRYGTFEADYPIHIACEYRNLEHIKLLCQHGADLTVLDFNHNVCESAVSGHSYGDCDDVTSWTPVVEYLCTQGAEPPRRDVLLKQYGNEMKDIDELKKY